MGSVLLLAKAAFDIASGGDEFTGFLLSDKDKALASKADALLYNGGELMGLDADNWDSKQVVKCASRAESFSWNSFVRNEVWHIGHESPSSSGGRDFEGNAAGAEGFVLEKWASTHAARCDSRASAVPSVICEREVKQIGQSSSVFGAITKRPWRRKI